MDAPARHRRGQPGRHRGACVLGSARAAGLAVSLWAFRTPLDLHLMAWAVRDRRPPINSVGEPGPFYLAWVYPGVVAELFINSLSKQIGGAELNGLLPLRALHRCERPSASRALLGRRAWLGDF